MSFKIDIHCHPQLKPYSRAHAYSPLVQSANLGHVSSLWYTSNPTYLEKSANNMLGLTLFPQANLSAAAKANVQVMVVAIGCIEKGFVQFRGVLSLFEQLLVNLTTGFGKTRINALKSMQDYWSDFQQEMAFIESGEGRAVKVGERWMTYELARDFKALERIIERNKKIPAQNTAADPFTIAFVPSVEGLHILNTGLGLVINENEVLAKLKILKNSPLRPWFVTMCHHFFNQLCGHSRSFKAPMINALDQSEGMDSGFTDLGKKVLAELLSDADGGPVFIDLKHMSMAARAYYIELLQQDRYKGKVPIIISHGVCNGAKDYTAKGPTHQMPGNTFYDIPLYDVAAGYDRTGKLIDNNQINFYDEEILEMIRTKGILGIQLDERRIANEMTFKKLKKTANTEYNEKFQYSLLVWNQVLHVAKLADGRGLPAWHHVAIGSDFDGIVDPLNRFWTLEEYDALEEFLLIHARNFIGTNVPHPMRHTINQLTAEEIISRLFRENAWSFFQKWYT